MNNPPSPDPQALGREALAHQKAGRWREAVECYLRLLAVAPDAWPACYNLALVYQAQQHWPDATRWYQRTLALNPQLAEAHNNLGSVLKAQGQAQQAKAAFQQALAVNPDLAEANFNLAALQQDAGALDAAVVLLRRSLAVVPAHSAAWDALTRALHGLARWDEAIAAFLDWERALPPSPEMVAMGLALARPMGDHARERRYVDLALRWPFPHSTAAQMASVLGMICYFDITRPQLFDCYRRYDAAIAGAMAPAVTPVGPAPSDPRRRIGYVSGDFCRHVMGRLMHEVLAHHDREQFAIVLFSTAPAARHDTLTAAIRLLADEFIDLADCDDAAAAQRIADRHLDVLVDLAGHTATSRPAIYAHQPAATIVTHLGYHGCLGLRAVACKFSDRVADLADAGDFQIERPYPLSGCVFPLLPAPSAAASAGPAEGFGAGLSLDGKFVFAAFVNVLKLSPRCLAAWRRVLDAVPEAVLLFSPFAAGEAAALERATAAAGIASERIAILVVDKNHPALAARYRLTHAVLDTFPYTGGDTTLAALAMGVPVLTLAGERQSERMGASILSHLGVEQLITHSEDAFVATAIRLAREPAFRATVRAAIDAGVAAAAGDPGAHTRALEAAFTKLCPPRGPSKSVPRPESTPPSL